MLLEIIQKRLIESRRQEIAQDARASIAAFHEGKLQPQFVDEIRRELQQTLLEFDS